jgi:hypothetical protein
MPTLAAVTAFVVGLGGAGCGEYSLDFSRSGPTAEAARRKPALWTMFDIRRAQREGRPVAPTDSFPHGMPNFFLNGLPTDEAVTLRINPAFSEGDAAAFVMPEVWINFDIVWVQPWYFLVTAWNDRSAQSNRLKNPEGMNVPPVWDVGPRSLFYSPLWLVYYAVVPPNTPQDRYTSAQQIFDDKLPIYDGPPIIYSVHPNDVGLDAKPVHPFLKTDVGLLSNVPRSFIDGEDMAYFVEGGSNWRYNEKLEAEEVPLFILARRDAEGNVVPTDWPPIMGSGPLFARRPADAPNGRPRFGGFSRIYFAVVSQTAEAFNPDLYPEVTANLLMKGFNPEAYRGRVASNGRKVAETDRVCFTQPEFPAGCNWLDSQQRVEDAAGVANIVKTEVTACSPLVFYGGKGIGR